MVDLEQLEGKSAEAVLNLDWPGYQEILRRQGPDYHYRPSVTLLQQVVRRNPDPNSTRAADQIELIRHLICHQALDDTKSSRDNIFHRACFSASLNIIKMLLAAGCTITAVELSALLYKTRLDIDVNADDNITKAIFLIGREHLDFNTILLANDWFLDDNQGGIRERIHRLDDARLNRAVLSQVDYDSLEKSEDVYVNLVWYKSNNLAKILTELGLPTIYRQPVK